MNVLLDLLDAGNSGEVQSATLLTLVSALMDHPENTRVRHLNLDSIFILTAFQSFEALDGLPTVCSLFRSRDTPREVKLRTLEFLYFYLMPEPPTKGTLPVPPAGQAAGRQRSAGKSRESRIDRTTEEKQALLGEYLSNVDSLVADLRENQPFGL